MNAKLQWLRNKMSSLNLQGLIISNPINIRYLTNIDAEGVLLLTRKENIYITDGRYIEHVHSILTLFDEIIVYDINDVAKEDYNTYERAETERLKMIGEETAEKTVKARTWYTQNLELLKTEKDGMAMLLKHSNSKFEISTLPCSRRLYWKFSLLLEAGVQEFNLDLRIVYSEKFSERNPAVGIVIKNANKKLERAISRSRRCEKSIYNDIEFPVVFMIEGIYKENNRSAAAAAVEGLIALLGSLRLSDVL